MSEVNNWLFLSLALGDNALQALSADLALRWSSVGTDDTYVFIRFFHDQKNAREGPQERSVFRSEERKLRDNAGKTA